MMPSQTRILITLAVSLLVFSPTTPDVFGKDTSPDLSFSSLNDLVLDAQGNILVVDYDSNQVFKVTRDGNLSVFAGTGQQREGNDSAGDGGPATQAKLRYPESIALGSQNEVYITDNDRVRRVDSSGIITTFAGGGSNGGIASGQFATDFRLHDIRAIEYDPRSGRLYIWQRNQRIWRVENDRIFHFAGSGVTGCKGDGGPPTEAQFDYINDMAAGPDGSLYLADDTNYRIRKIDPTGSAITNVVGNGRFSSNRIPDGTLAVRTGMRYPKGLAFDSQGLLHLINDVGVIHRLETDGSLTLFSNLSDLPSGEAAGTMVFDPAGNLIIADQYTPRILEVSADGSRVRTIVRGSNSGMSQGISDLSPMASPGVSRNKPAPRDAHSIIGGEEVSFGEWPMVVRVDTPTGICTASLVAPNWVLTAAHCLIDHDGSVDDPSDISVFLGHDWDRGVCENTRDEIGRVIIHPDYYYEGAGFRNDAALIEILEPAPAAPIRILTPEEEAWHAPSGSTASAVGWGRTDDRSYPPILHHVDIPVWTPVDCLRDSLWRSDEVVHERTLCAGKEGMGADLGDSGGPLLVALPDGDWGQVGISSQWGGARKGYPTVYTRTSALYDWIHQHIDGGLQFSRIDAGQVLISERGRTIFLAGNQFEGTDGEGTVSTGSYAFQSHGPRTGTLTLTYDDGASCTVQLTFTSATTGTSSYRCSDQSSGSESFQVASPPSPPTHLTATAFSSSRIDLAWQDNSSNETGFRVQRRVDGSDDWIEIGTTAANINTFSDEGLEPLTLYHYRVLAFSANAASEFSNEAMAMTLQLPPNITRFTPASGPVGTRVTVTGTHFLGVTDVRFNRVSSLEFEVVSMTSIRAIVPPEATSGPISVVTPGGTAVSADPFTVTVVEISSRLFVPVLLTSAGRNNAFFTSELTLTNRGTEEAILHYTYTARSGGGNGTATDKLAPGRQRIRPDAIGYLTGLGIPIPGSGNRIGTLRVEVSGSSEVSVTTRTTTAVPDGRAGLSYPGIAQDEGFQEAVYLCGMRENTQDRSNVAFQHMGAPDEGSITLRTTVYSGEADDTSPRIVGEVELQPGGFHQYSGLLGRLGTPAQGYVKVEKVGGEAPFYAYGVINDNFNSDGSFVFPLTQSVLVGTSGQTLPVIIETGTFQSELILTNFSTSDKQVDFSFVVDPAEAGSGTATFSLSLKAGEQSILPNLVSWLRQQEVAGIGPAGRPFVRALFATPAEGDMSGIVIGARTGSPDKRGGQYSLFYNGVPYGSASVESAWIYGLQQNAENRSNLALVNTGEIDDSSSTFEITIYDGSGERKPRTKSVTLGPRRWTQENGILGNISQGYVQVRKTSGNNPFVTYGVVNDGGRPGERSGDGAFLLSQE